MNFSSAEGKSLPRQFSPHNELFRSQDERQKLIIDPETCVFRRCTVMAKRKRKINFLLFLHFSVFQIAFCVSVSWNNFQFATLFLLESLKYSRGNLFDFVKRSQFHQKRSAKSPARFSIFFFTSLWPGARPSKTSKFSLHCCNNRF